MTYLYEGIIWLLNTTIIFHGLTGFLVTLMLTIAISRDSKVVSILMLPISLLLASMGVQMNPILLFIEGLVLAGAVLSGEGGSKIFVEKLAGGAVQYKKIKERAKEAKRADILKEIETKTKGVEYASKLTDLAIRRINLEGSKLDHAEKIRWIKRRAGEGI